MLTGSVVKVIKYVASVGDFSCSYIELQYITLVFKATKKTQVINAFLEKTRASSEKKKHKEREIQEQIFTQ